MPAHISTIWLFGFASTALATICMPRSYSRPMLHQRVAALRQHRRIALRIGKGPAHEVETGRPVVAGQRRPARDDAVFRAPSRRWRGKARSSARARSPA